MIKATFGTGMFNRSKHADALFLFFHPYILLVAESNDRVKSGNILLYHLRTTCEAVLKNGMKLDEFNIFIYHIEDNDKRFKKKTIKDFKKLAEKSIITLFKEFCKRPHTKQECITESNNNGTQMRGQKNNDEVEQQENEENKEKIESWRKSRAERALRNTVLAEINRGIRSLLNPHQITLYRLKRVVKKVWMCSKMCADPNHLQKVLDILLKEAMLVFECSKRNQSLQKDQRV